MDGWTGCVDLEWDYIVADGLINIKTVYDCLYAKLYGAALEVGRQLWPLCKM